MKIGFAAGLLVCAAGVALADDPPAGFGSLFNGKDFSGWTVPAGDNGHWKILDGVIDYDARSEAKGEKHLWHEKEFGDFELFVDWRIKETPYTNPRARQVLPDGTDARDAKGEVISLALPDSDSGVLLRGSMKFQVNIWCWPVGSGEMYGVRTDKATPPDVRAAVTPKAKADKPIGEWNRFHITARGDTVKVELNGVTVLEGAKLPGLPAKGRIGFQHHGAVNAQGEWTSPPALVQFRNVFVRELPAP